MYSMVGWFRSPIERPINWIQYRKPPREFTVIPNIPEEIIE